jgi:hypothetical protein
MYLKTEGGEQFVSESPKGPWIPRLPRQAVLEAKKRRQEKRRKEKVMGQSGFDRAFEESEKRRRRSTPCPMAMPPCPRPCQPGK